MIAIKVMEMPKSCSECQFKARESWWNAPYKGECNLSEKSTGSESEDK